MKPGDLIKSAGSRSTWTVLEITKDGELTAWRMSNDKDKRGKKIVRRLSRPELYRVVKLHPAAVNGGCGRLRGSEL